MMARSDGEVGLIVSRRVKEEGCHRAIEEDLQAFVVPVPVPGCEGIISLEARHYAATAMLGHVQEGHVDLVTLNWFVVCLQEQRCSCNDDEAHCCGQRRTSDMRRRPLQVTSRDMDERVRRHESSAIRGRLLTVTLIK